MQKQIVEGMHTFSHLITHTDFGHHEEDHALGHEHSHEHEMISFFSKIFSSEEKTNNHEEVVSNYTLDKHFKDEYPNINFKFKPLVKHIYHYTFHIPKSVKTIPSPPPKTFFS